MTTVDWRTWVPERLAYPEVPVGALLDGAARRYGDRVAFRHHDRTLTFTGLWRAASGFAHHLHARGVVPGDVVGVHLPNVLAFPVAYYGILLAGATFTPVSPQLPPDGVAAQLADAGAVAVVGLADVGAGVPLIATDGVGFDGVGATPRHRPWSTSTPPSPAPTSPTPAARPAAPRASCSRTRTSSPTSCSTRATAAGRVRSPGSAARWGSSRSGRRRSGRSASARAPGSPSRRGSTRWARSAASASPWCPAATSIVHERFDPARFLADVETHRATTISGAPPLFHALLAHPEAAQRDLTSVRTVTSGAAPMPLALARRIAERMPEAVIVEGYGMTEATMGLTIGATARSAHRRVGTVGVPVPDTEIRIGSPDAPGRGGRGRRGVGARSAGDGRLPRPAGGHRGDAGRRVAADRRHRRARRGRPARDRRPGQGHAALQGLQRVPARARGAAARPAPRSRRPRSWGGRTRRSARSPSP